MAIVLRVHGASVPIDEEVFTTLLDNSVAGTYRGYERALESGSIKFAELAPVSVPLPPLDWCRPCTWLAAPSRSL